MKSTSLSKKKILNIFMRIEKNAQRLKLFRCNSLYLIAVSGGQDSICLAMFLRSFQRKYQLQIDIVYCHHAWQQDSFYNIIQITKFAAYSEMGCFVFLNSTLY